MSMIIRTNGRFSGTLADGKAEGIASYAAVTGVPRRICRAADNAA
jgi:hypothetical protein